MPVYKLRNVLHLFSDNHQNLKQIHIFNKDREKYLNKLTKQAKTIEKLQNELKILQKFNQELQLQTQSYLICTITFFILLLFFLRVFGVFRLTQCVSANQAQTANETLGYLETFFFFWCFKVESWNCLFYFFCEI